MAIAAQRTTSVLPIQGLSEAEVSARRARGEGNEVEFVPSRSYLRIIRENAFTFINTLLFIIAILLIALGLTGDAVMTAGLVLVNVVAGVVQEGKAKRQLDRIALLTRPSATVVREGREKTIDPNEIVRGDVIVLRAGDQILADGRVVGESRMDIDESLLTGESDAITKYPGDRVFSGSFCTSGYGYYEAEKVGRGSLAQEITARARAFRQVRTPLQREVGWIIRAAVVLIVLLAFLVADSFREIYGGLPLVESVQAAAVIVALVPQGLYLMVTVTYAMAAVRMAGRGALIQRTNAVESISHVNVLCVDKTGTLTTNRLKLHAVWPTEPTGEPALRQWLGDYAASTTGGNRTNDAIAEACPGQSRRVVEQVPFSSSRKWSALAFGDPALRGIYVLGAPEMVLPKISSSGVDGRIAELTAQGLRVLVFAGQPAIEPLRDASGQGRLPGNLALLGLLSFNDELRPEASETIKQFSDAGIALKIISGDHPDTVSALARQAGLAQPGRVVSGLTIDALDDAVLGQVAEDTTIFGRVTPQQKERLVMALRAKGHYVAMIGDGVNDILALKQANLAVAMRSGSQATRSVADLVLLNDSFAVLPQTVQEGRRILRGMQDIIRLFLVRTTYLMMLVSLTALIGLEFPITPKHNAILALLTVGIPTLALATWAKPGIPAKHLLRSSATFVIPATLSITLVGLVIYTLFHELSGDLTQARTALTTTTLLCGVLLLPFLEPPTEAWTGGDRLSGDWRPTILAAGMFLLYLTILAVPGLRAFYEIEILPLAAYAVIGLVVLGWASGLRFIWRLQLATRLRSIVRRLRRRSDA